MTFVIDAFAAASSWEFASHLKTRGCNDIIGRMNEFIDRIVLLVLCCALSVRMFHDPACVTGFLFALCFICVSEICSSRKWTWLRIALQAAFYACCILIPVMMTYLPVAIYVAMHERNRPARFLWAIPLAWMVFFSQQAVEPKAFETVLAAAALLLAIRDTRMMSDLLCIRLAYDDARATNISSSPDEVPDDGPADRQPLMPSVFDSLTKRELAIARLVADGKDNRDIANELFLSEGTVRNHISSILSKMELSNRTQIAVAFYKER